MPLIEENGEVETHRSTILPLNQIDSVVNNNQREKYDNKDEQSSNDNINGFDSMNELIEAQKQITLLRKNLNETNGNLKRTMLGLN